MTHILPTEHEEIDLLTRAAHEAGRIAMSYFGKSPETWWKDNNSPVSEGDYAVDRYLKDTLLTARSDYGWVSEESVLEGSFASTIHEDRFFIVDPIDGTRAYLRGEASWCVSIALISGNRPLAGAIFAPVTGEMFAVTRSGDALLNGERLASSRAVTDAAMTIAMPDQFRAAFRRMGKDAQRKVTPERGVPSLAYRLCLVAAGRIDATLIRPRAHDWDIAAGDLLLEKANAALVDEKGEPLLYTRAAKRHGLLVAASNHMLIAARDLAEAVSNERPPANRRRDDEYANREV